MAQSSTLCLGMEVHKESVAVAYVAQAHGAAVPSLGTIGTRQCAIDPRIRKRRAKAQQLLFGYAAGPCGSWLYRSLTQKGYDGWVVAPSLIPPKPGARVNTARRAAVPLARLARSGALPVVYVPKVADAAMRDLPRAREEASSDGKDTQVRLKAHVLRQASRYVGRAHGNPVHRRWLSAVGCPTPVQHMGFPDYGRAVTEHTARLQRLEPDLRAQVQAWRLPPVGEALHALRSVPWTVAVTLVADIGALTRCETGCAHGRSGGGPQPALAEQRRWPRTAWWIIRPCVAQSCGPAIPVLPGSAAARRRACCWGQPPRVCLRARRSQRPGWAPSSAKPVRPICAIPPARLLPHGLT